MEIKRYRKKLYSDHQRASGIMISTYHRINNNKLVYFEHSFQIRFTASLRYFAMALTLLATRLYCVINQLRFSAPVIMGIQYITDCQWYDIPPHEVQNLTKEPFMMPPLFECYCFAPSAPLYYDKFYNNNHHHNRQQKGNGGKQLLQYHILFNVTD